MKIALPFGVSTPADKREPYRNALRAVGLEPVEGVSSLDGLAGLFLAGGADVDPSVYGAARLPECEESDPDRDRLESALLREALRRDLPVLAICRGLQLMNAVLGGTLEQHIHGHNHRKLRDAHEVRLEPGTLVERILGGERYVVNSRHHQCAGRIAPGYTLSAIAPDGVVEAIEDPRQRFALAVQWHPEARIDGADLKLFRAFSAAVEAR
ncbi:MAG TPA: gamma-glutamyl-gamma-aminobutyrate hydrolase family protein [Bryobacteraceae bacterium]|nr:gamma-glutamyl-gamma-aminobutyrate hydrolase family protein [Bryobacteraceae bacterium]